MDMITELVEELYAEELKALDEIHTSSTQCLPAQRKAKVETAAFYLSRLKEKVLDYAFSSQEEEIHFFKT